MRRLEPSNLSDIGGTVQGQCNGQRVLIDLTRRLRQRDVAVSFISHNLVDIFAVADRILVPRRGLATG